MYCHRRRIRRNRGHEFGEFEISLRVSLEIDSEKSQCPPGFMYLQSIPHGEWYHNLGTNEDEAVRIVCLVAWS